LNRECLSSYLQRKSRLGSVPIVYFSISDNWRSRNVNCVPKYLSTVSVYSYPHLSDIAQRSFCQNSTLDEEQGFSMQLNQANAEFRDGYFSTHDRRAKTKAAYCSDLAQFQTFAGEEIDLLSLDGGIIERWAAHLRQQGYSPASIRRKMVSLRIFC